MKPIIFFVVIAMLVAVIINNHYTGRMIYETVDDSTLMPDLTDVAQLQSQLFQPQPQPMRRTCQGPSLIAGSPSTTVAEMIALSSPIVGGSQEFYLAYPNFVDSTVHTFGLGMGTYGSGSGDHAISYPATVHLYPKVAASGNVLAYAVRTDAASLIVVQYAGPDGIMGTQDDPRSVAASSYGQWAPQVYVFGVGNSFDTASNGLVYMIDDSTTTTQYIIRQDAGADNTLRFPYLYPSDDLIEVASPAIPMNDILGYLQTSSTKVSSWVRSLSTGYITEVIDPGSDNFFNGVPPSGDDVFYAIGGGNVDSWNTRLSYDGQELITAMRYPSGCTPATPTGCTIWADVYTHPGGRLPQSPSQTVPLPFAPNIVPEILAVDIDGSYASSTGTIRSSLAVAYFTPDANGIYNVFNLFYDNTGLNGVYFDADDQTAFYQVQDPSMNPGNVIDLVVKENKIGVVTVFNRRHGLYYFTC